MNNFKATIPIFLMLSLTQLAGCGGDDGGTQPPTGPEITSISPTMGPPGATVTIGGSGFSATASENTVTFNGTPAEVSSATTSQLETIVPEDATSGPVEVTVAGESAIGPEFIVEEQMPGISSIEPDNGMIGTEVTIRGMNFGPTPAENSITFNGTEAPVNEASDTLLVTEVPKGATGGPVEVTVNGQTATGPDFNVLPDITSVQPLEGTVGTEVTITGTGFSPTASENTVAFNGTEADVSAASSTQLTTTVPSGATSGPITVSVGGDQANGPTFTVEETAPVITAVEPDSGAVGTEVTITGMNFSATAAENTITFNGTEAPVNAASETELVTEVPEGATGGNVKVIVEGKTSEGINFDVRPQITNVTPLQGVVGTEVTITGTGFSSTASDNKVTFGGTEATVSSASQTQLITNVPVYASSGPIKVMVDGDVATGPEFTVESQIIINEFLPDPGGDANNDGTSDSSEDEFVEIVNPTGTPIDLSGFEIIDSEGNTYTFPSGTMLKKVAVVFGGGSPSGFSSDIFVDTGSPTLNNAGDTITLTDGFGTTLAQISFGDEGDLVAPEGESLTRDPDITGMFFLHLSETDSGLRFSPGARVDGSDF